VVTGCAGERRSHTATLNERRKEAGDTGEVLQFLKQRYGPPLFFHFYIKAQFQLPLIKIVNKGGPVALTPPPAF